MAWNLRRTITYLLLIASATLIAACQAGKYDEELLFSTRADKLGIAAVAFSTDGKWIFSAGSEGLKQWESHTFKLTSDPKIEIGKPGFETTYSIGSIASCPTRPELYLAGGRNDIVVWNYDTRKETSRIPNSGVWISALAINKQGTLLAIAENDLDVDLHGKGEFNVRVWDLEKSKTKYVLVGHSQAISSLDFAYAGNLLISRAHIGAIVWNVETGAVQVRIGHLGDAEFENPAIDESRNALFSPDDHHVLYFGGLISTDSWIETAQFSHGARASAFAPDGRHVLLSGNGKSVLFDIKSRAAIAEFVQFPKTQEPIRCVAISPDGTLAVTGGWGTHIRWPDYSQPNEVNRNLCVWRLPKLDPPKK